MRKPPLLELAAATLAAIGVAHAATTVTTMTPPSATSSSNTTVSSSIDATAPSTTATTTTSGTTTITSKAIEPPPIITPAPAGTTAVTINSGTRFATGDSAVIGVDTARASPATNTSMSGASTLNPSDQTSGSVELGQTTSGTGRTTTVQPLDNSGNASTTTATTTTPTISGAGGVIIGANGERIVVNTVGSAQAAPVQPIATPELDAAAKAALARDRAKVARKGQLLHSQAPRTNNDRTNQMPDNPGPLLTPSG